MKILPGVSVKPTNAQNITRRLKEMNDIIAQDIHHQLVNMNKTLDIICKSLKLMAEGDLK